jgi:serine/threonine protein kinase
MVEFECTTGAMLPGDYTITRGLGNDVGKGVYGVVCFAKKDDQEVAVKIQSNTVETFMEMALLKTLNHPSIMKMIKAFVDKPNRLVYIYQSVGLPKVPSGVPLMDIAYHLLSALEYLQEHGIVHNDIKTANIIWVGNRPVIIDFGIARILPAQERIPELNQYDNTRRFTLQSPHCRAPEMWNDQPYDSRVDVFSVGCCLYEYMAGERLFFPKGTTFDKKTFFRELAVVDKRVKALNLPGFAEDIILKMLEPKRDKRPFASELVKMVTRYITVPLDRSEPPKLDYPYPMKSFLTEEQREEVQNEIMQGLRTIGIWDSSNVTNCSAWFVLAGEIVDWLIRMVVGRSSIVEDSYIPGGNGHISLATIPRAVSVALLMLTTWDIIVSDYDAAIEVIHEYFSFRKAFVIPKTLITTSRDARVWHTSSEFFKSFTGRAIGPYVTLMTDPEWVTYDEPRAEGVLDQRVQ